MILKQKKNNNDVLNNCAHGDQNSDFINYLWNKKWAFFIFILGIFSLGWKRFLRNWLLTINASESKNWIFFRKLYPFFYYNLKKKTEIRKKSSWTVKIKKCVFFILANLSKLNLGHHGGTHYLKCHSVSIYFTIFYLAFIIKNIYLWTKNIICLIVWIEFLHDVEKYPIFRFARLLYKSLNLFILRSILGASLKILDT